MPVAARAALASRQRAASSAPLPVCSRLDPASIDAKALALLDASASVARDGWRFRFN